MSMPRTRTLLRAALAGALAVTASLTPAIPVSAAAAEPVGGETVMGDSAVGPGPVAPRSRRTCGSTWRR